MWRIGLNRHNKRRGRHLSAGERGSSLSRELSTSGCSKNFLIAVLYSVYLFVFYPTRHIGIGMHDWSAGFLRLSLVVKQAGSSCKTALQSSRSRLGRGPLRGVIAAEPSPLADSRSILCYREASTLSVVNSRSRWVISLCRAAKALVASRSKLASSEGRVARWGIGEQLSFFLNGQHYGRGRGDVQRPVSEELSYTIKT